MHGATESLLSFNSQTVALLNDKSYQVAEEYTLGNLAKIAG